MEKARSCPAKRVFVGNLHNSVTEGDLIKLFQRCGTVTDVNYMWHKSGPKIGQPKGFAFVGMNTDAEADRAIAKLNGLDLKGRKLVVSQSENEELIVRSSRGSNYSRGAASSAGRSSSLAGANSATPSSSILAASGTRKRENEASDTAAVKKQRKEVQTVDERMKRLKEALSGIS